MKDIISKRYLIIALIITSFSFANAQNQSAKFDHCMNSEQSNICQKGYFGISDLTPDQITKIDDLKLQHIKDVTLLKDQLKEKRQESIHF